MSTFTTTKQLEQVARGADVGTWDTPTNSNWGITDAALGQIATIGLNNSNVILSAGQFQCKEIVFNSTLTGNVTITFPTSFTGPYTIQNLCTGSSAFTITMTTTAAGAQAICCPPIEMFDMWNDGTNLKYRNFERVGTYWDYAGSSVPAWVSGCTVPPYLNCDGTTFSSGTYPALFMILGSATLPDSRGSVRAALNQTTGRLTSSVGVDGNTLAARGGSQTTTLSSLHLPQLVDPSHRHDILGDTSVSGNSGLPTLAAASQGATGHTTFVVTGITYGSSSQIGTPAVQPTYIGGLTMIRAA